MHYFSPRKSRVLCFVGIGVESLPSVKICVQMLYGYDAHFINLFVCVIF